MKTPEGGERPLAPDSESGPDAEESHCGAARIGLVVGGNMRPLASDGCGDSAQDEETMLLDEDAGVSDVPCPPPGQHAKVHLCAHPAFFFWLNPQIMGIAEA
ncbi:unnamed protein product [Polarella glacialis]|uniref:Uncharacterized protein n=1 Tax=Polarella glacialis TaxID=89957 RepID=A0A813ELT6_POLGL|nr:unnamed protein product [Polarella glacialis]CAE8685078.1 unnamed protein product [Polarella glacialis]